jgi:4-carboxymuconolactone decarboxylase
MADFGVTRRLRPLRREELDVSQSALWDSIVNSARGADARVVATDHLGGPFDAWLRSPEMGLRAAQLGEVLRFGSKLDPLVRETAIMAAGAHFRSEFEFWIHSQIALSEGMAPATVEEIAAGHVDHERSGAVLAVVNQCSRRMLSSGGLDDDMYAPAVELLGETGLMEVVSLVGYYTLVSLTLNVFRVPLPEGVTARWPTNPPVQTVKTVKTVQTVQTAPEDQR